MAHLKVTDNHVPFILLMNEGRTRALDQRAQAFLNRYNTTKQRLWTPAGWAWSACLHQWWTTLTGAVLQHRNVRPCGTG